MKFEKNKVVLIFSVALLIGLVYFNTYHMQDRHSNNKSSTDPIVMPVKEALLKLSQQKNFQRLNKQEKLDEINQVLEDLPPEYQNLKRQYQIALSTLPNITFYGRALDQYGQPVKNAKVWYEATNTYLSAGGGRGQVQTDEQGYFEIDTEGAALVVRGVGHPEIDTISFPPPEYRASTTWGGIYYTIIKFLSYKDKEGVYPTWQDHTEKSKAYIVNAWRLGEYEGAIKGDAPAGLLADGRTYTLKLNGSNKRNRLIEGQHKGDFYISCTRPHIESYKEHFDWSVSLTPVNGGIQETDDLYMNLAPETGYQSSLNIVMRKGSESYKHRLLNKRYYFTTDNGKNYGSLFVHFEPFASIEEDACNVRISYTINPTSSRNLELRKDNTSQPKLPTTNQLASN